jgi:acyl-CoA thioester hydrolase
MLRDTLRRVEHVDTDAAGVVHFARYASLLETSVLENLERLHIGVRRLAEDELDLAVTQLQLKYQASARYHDPIRIRVQVDRVSGASVLMSGQFHLMSEGVEPLLLAEGTLLLCVVRRSDGTATGLPKWLRSTLKQGEIA